MISIIICSRNNNLERNLIENVERTIGGVEFEIICIDNSTNKYSMCSAYNEGIRRSKYEFLCFMHEDVTFLSENWGALAISKLNDKSTWLLGILGTKYFNGTSTYWWPSPYCVGHNWNGGLHRVFNNSLKEENVVVTDGLWLFTRKDIFKDVKWDEETYKGFDFYDMDLCMQILLNGGQIKIIPDIHIDHHSDGNYSSNFYKTCLLFHNKWDAYLPVMTNDIPSETAKEASRIALNRICDLECCKSQFIRRDRKFLFRLASKIDRILSTIK